MKLIQKEENKYYTRKSILGIKHTKYKIIKIAEDILNSIRSLNFVEKRHLGFIANDVAKRHEDAFAKYKGINYGKEVVIIATGPTLADFKPIENAVYIGVNRAVQYEKVKLDYLFAQSYHAIKDYMEDICKLDIPKFFGELILSNKTHKDLRIPEFEYIKANAKKYYHEYYKNFADIPVSIDTWPIAANLTVSHAALHFALYTHPKKIYLVGCDTTSAPYWDNKEREEAYLEKADFINDGCVDGYKRFKTFASIHYPDVEIISINPVGLKGIFTDIYTK